MATAISPASTNHGGLGNLDDPPAIRRVVISPASTNRGALDNLDDPPAFRRVVISPASTDRGALGAAVPEAQSNGFTSAFISTSVCPPRSTVTLVLPQALGAKSS